MLGWLKSRKNNQRAQYSNAHLLLLSKFLKPGNPELLTRNPNWESVLGVPTTKAIERLKSDGMIEACDLPGALSARFKVSELRALLKEAGLKVSGKKEEMAQRLADQATTSAKQALGNFDALQCTEAGEALAAEFLDRQKAERQSAEQEALQQLRKKDFLAAAKIVQQFELNQVFPRGLGMDWGDANLKKTTRELKNLFETTPSILADMPEVSLPDLRVAAGMDMLWGTNKASQWLPKEFETGHRLDTDTAARMMVFRVWHDRNLSQYSDYGGKKVRIRTVNDRRRCEACKALDGETYSITNVPELPFAKCTCEIGCRCGYDMSPMLDRD